MNSFLEKPWLRLADHPMNVRSAPRSSQSEKGRPQESLDPAQCVEDGRQREANGCPPITQDLAPFPFGGLGTSWGWEKDKRSIPSEGGVLHVHFDMTSPCFPPPGSAGKLIYPAQRALG